MSFEEILTQEFGDKHTLLDNYVPLQLSHTARKMPKTNNGSEILSFIEKYRNSLSTYIKNSQKFAYKIFITPNIGKNRNTADAAIKFVNVSDNPEEIEKYEGSIIATIDKKVPIANLGKFKPSDVVKKIEEKTDEQKTINWHTKMWKKHKVRPPTSDENKLVTKEEYCQYDEPHKDYIYTEKWVDFLIEKEINQRT